MCSPICRRIRESWPASGGAAGGARGSGRYGLSMCSGGSSPAVPRLDERQHVLLADAPAATGARHLAEVDPVLGRDPLDDRGVAAPGAVGASGAGADRLDARNRCIGRVGRGSPCGRCGRLGGGGSRLLPCRRARLRVAARAGRDPRQHRPDLDRLLDRDEDLGHHAR